MTVAEANVWFVALGDPDLAPLDPFTTRPPQFARSLAAEPMFTVTAPAPLDATPSLTVLAAVGARLTVKPVTDGA